MKNYQKSIILFAAVILLAGCTTTVQNTVNPTATPATSSSPTTTTTFSASQLAAFNGKNGAKCYVAIDGKVYDLTSSPFWRNGEHTPSGGQAKCGLDLSTVIPADHRADMRFADFPMVGTLQ